MKQIICSNEGITLIVVPYWWNKSIDSLAHTIHDARPDVMLPPSLKTGLQVIPTAPPYSQHPIYQPHQYTATPTAFHCTGWWMLEKYGGIRVCWNGSTLTDTRGRLIKVPPSCKANLPITSFEAQLRSPNAWNAVLYPTEENWKRVQLLAFDSPFMYSSSYEQRIQHLRDSIQRSNQTDKHFAYIVVVPDRVTSVQHLRSKVSRKGLIFRRPGSNYTERNSSLWFTPMKEVNAVVISCRPTLWRLMDAYEQEYYCVHPPQVSVTPGSTIVTLQCSRSTLKGSSHSIVSQIRPELTWSSVHQSAYPYYVGRGVSSQARCRGCGYQFKKQDLRIRSTLLRSKESPPGRINICLKLECIRKTLNRYRNWQVEPFLAKIRVPSDVKEQLPLIDGIHFVHENKV